MWERANPMNNNNWKEKWMEGMIFKANTRRQIMEIESLLKELIQYMFENFPVDPDGTVSAKDVVRFKKQLMNKWL
jgi:hypothetical protein